MPENDVFRGLPVLEIAERHTAAPDAALLERAVENQKAVGVGKRQRLDQHAVDDAEERRINPDPQSEAGNDDGGYAAVPDQAAEGVANVLAEHGTSLPQTLLTRRRCVEALAKADGPRVRRSPCPRSTATIRCRWDEPRIEQPRPTSREHVVPARPDRTISFLAHPR